METLDDFRRSSVRSSGRHSRSIRSILNKRAAGQVYMAKLRRDMFDWFYDGIEIFGYDKKGRDELEEQEKFD